MKKEQSIIVSAALLVLMAALYRILPNRPLGFAPQIAMAVFAGSAVADKKLSFLLPLFSMLVSDIIYQVLFQYQLSPIPGFYDGQALNYALFAAITVIGFVVKKSNPIQILVGSIAGATLYFLLSNFVVWIGGGLDINNLAYPKTINGLVNCYAAAVPFFRGSLYGTLSFSALLFGGNYFISKWMQLNTIVA